MRKIVSIFFLGLYLFSTTEAYQLFKLPLIFEHYHEHKLADNNISFIQFLVMHYSEDDPGDGDYQRDMKLPFKTSNHVVRSIVPVTVPESFDQVQLPKLFSEPQVFLVQNDQLVSSRAICKIFQPPRFV